MMTLKKNTSTCIEPVYGIPGIGSSQQPTEEGILWAGQARREDVCLWPYWAFGRSLKNRRLEINSINVRWVYLRHINNINSINITGGHS